jgi:hypothetical protein
MADFRFYGEEIPRTPGQPNLWSSPDQVLGNLTVSDVRQVCDHQGLRRLELILQPGNKRAWFWVVPPEEDTDRARRC